MSRVDGSVDGFFGAAAQVGGGDRLDSRLAGDYEMNRRVTSQMRQRLQRFFPIVLIALVVQILAPIGACWAAAFAASDPLRAIEICHSDPASTSERADQGSSHRDHDGACAICCVTQANASFDSPQPVAIAIPYRDVARVVWRDCAPYLSRAPPGSNAQARAPPFPS
jgi:Protein of unknown function (DUF2946)